jgi:hypothetical protein
MGGGIGKPLFRTPPLVKVRMVRGGPENFPFVDLILCFSRGLRCERELRVGRLRIV